MFAVFGLGTLISSGLEISTVFTMPEKCMDDVLNMIQPILLAVFNFIQMHFLFMSAKVSKDSFKDHKVMHFIHYCCQIFRISNKTKTLVLTLAKNKTNNTMEFRKLVWLRKILHLKEFFLILPQF